MTKIFLSGARFHPYSRGTALRDEEDTGFPGRSTARGRNRGRRSRPFKGVPTRPFWRGGSGGGGSSGGGLGGSTASAV